MLLSSIHRFFDGPLPEEEQHLALPAPSEAADGAEQSSSSSSPPPPSTALAFLSATRKADDMQPGRINEVRGMAYQDEVEYGGMCEDRAQNGYNSGMGEIFRRVAQISPIVPVTVPAISG